MCNLVDKICFQKNYKFLYYCIYDSLFFIGILNLVFDVINIFVSQFLISKGGNIKFVDNIIYRFIRMQFYDFLDLYILFQI